MKKILINLFIFIAVLLCPTLVNAEEYTYTIDNANLLKKDTKEYIDNYSSFLAQNNNFKYFVVTEKQLGVYSLEDLADSYFEQLNVGRKGILILYVKDKQALYIEVGKDISDFINNNVIQQRINANKWQIIPRDSSAFEDGNKKIEYTLGSDLKLKTKEDSIVTIKFKAAKK